MNFNDNWLLVNMDETPVYLDMISDITIDFVGAENVSFETTRRDKYRLTVLLSICANGWKLPLLVLFKGEIGKTIEKKLRKLEFCQKGQIFVYTQKSGWCKMKLSKSGLKIFFYLIQIGVKKKFY